MVFVACEVNVELTRSVLNWMLECISMFVEKIMMRIAIRKDNKEPVVGNKTLS